MSRVNAFFMPAPVQKFVRSEGLRVLSRTAVVIPLLCGSLAAACAAQSPEAGPSGSVSFPDSARAVEDLRVLSGAAMGGRETGTPGNEAARLYIESAFRAAGVDSLPGSALRHEFLLPGGGPARVAANVVGYIRGSEQSGRFIVVGAHFDHLGTRGADIYFGADDNASGTAALIELARYFAAHPPRNSIVFAAFDAEERGLRGAEEFVSNPPVPLDSVLIMINLDMIGRSDQNELFVAGTAHYPFLSAIVDEVAAASRLRLRKGHDRPDGSAGDDWTYASDHGPFHGKGVPFLYFGVEDHADYHRPTDTFERIQQGFYIEAIRAVRGAVEVADRELP